MQKDLLLREVSDTVRATLCEMLGVSLAATKMSEIPADVAEESGEIADDFLQNF